ncbi:MAG: hypothetical protein IM653_02900 [Phenylobacterium sp.]|uniref:hypothetical protein n=1 Tax=Phenylobacterium sp. TaxID=1871053 RepID=UPI0025FEFC74|nr:hypothetical protein [Phenylobacterium sp.]MCA6225128.1 hypothetical protein [Phenylobacterium sp.]MCA6227065.1 hypothetical protein [Phenylobacterium sp.]MCA6230682.1 hypothetical protein [Phenylobacterium sp.]MCA6234062.1 hypothetical protein [Phenylobacterium sp.]MCA6249862.1 hypothetical protein [Phenylobacterium sp.]
MDNKINAAPSTADPVKGNLQPPVAKPTADKAELFVPRYEPSPASERRLVIEPSGGSYVYKIIDRKTGEVIWQYPLEEVVRRRNEGSYAAGDIIRTSV